MKSITPVTLTRSYEQVVEHIQNAIMTGAFTPGQKLPTERELGKAFGVSRSVIREAIRVLDTLGLVESRQGSGLYVRRNLVPMVTRALTLSVTPEMASLTRLFEFRCIIEEHASRLAAARHTAGQLAAIMTAAAASYEGVQAFDLTDDPSAFEQADDAFHAAVAAAADNLYLAILMRAVRAMQTDVLWQLLHEIPGSIATAAQHHQRIAAAIEAGDADASARAMREHISYTGSQVIRLVGATARSTLQDQDGKEGPS